MPLLCVTLYRVKPAEQTKVTAISKRDLLCVPFGGGSLEVRHVVCSFEDLTARDLA